MTVTEPMAVLFGYDPETGEHTADPLVGLNSSGDDPITWAHGLKASVEDDFPGWYQQVLTKGDMLDYYDVSGCYILKVRIGAT